MKDKEPYIAVASVVVSVLFVWGLYVSILNPNLKLRILVGLLAMSILLNEVYFWRRQICTFLAENGQYLLWGVGVSPIILLVTGFFIVHEPFPALAGFVLFPPAVLAARQLPNQSERDEDETLEQKP